VEEYRGKLEEERRHQIRHVSDEIRALLWIMFSIIIIIYTLSSKIVHI